MKRVDPSHRASKLRMPQTRPDLPQDPKSLRGRMWTLATQLAMRNGLAKCILNCPKGCDPRPSVLVIEDDESSANLAQDSLQHLFNMEIADDGARGLTVYQARRQALILLDLRLPDMPGEEVISGDWRSHVACRAAR